MPSAQLTTERLVLRPPQMDDAQAVFDTYARDPAVARFVIWTPHASVEDTRAFLRTFVADARGQDAYPWIITRGSGEVIGAMHLRVHAPRAEFGFNLASGCWNQGYGTESVRAVIAFAFTLPGVERVQAVCHVDNGTSARAMEKAGMRREGRLARYLVFPNLGPAAQDVWLYARTIADGIDG